MPSLGFDGMWLHGLIHLNSSFGLYMNFYLDFFASSFLSVPKFEK